MIIKVLGSGCKNCQKLYANAEEALQELGLEGDVQKVTDFAEISKYNAMRMPALVIDDKVVASGRVLKTEEIINTIEKQ